LSFVCSDEYHRGTRNNKKSEPQILELAPEYRYSVLDHPYSSTSASGCTTVAPFLGALPYRRRARGFPVLSSNAP
jgi:hypothetical protein